MKRKARKTTVDLHEVLSDVEGLGQSRAAHKDSAVIFRVSVAEKEQIRETAHQLGLSVSAYLLDLHRIALERIGS